MKSIKVKICFGTTCFVMGSSYLNDLFEIIPQKYGNKVSVEPAVCLEQCSKTDKHSKAPYVKIDDDIISEATVEKILDTLDRKIEQNG